MSALRKIQPAQVLDFELTNCPDPKCFICVKKLQGYPSELKLHPFHTKQITKSMATILNWIGEADVIS